MKSKKKVVQASSIGLLISITLCFGLLGIMIIQAAQIIDLELTVRQLSESKVAPSENVSEPGLSVPDSQNENVLFWEDQKIKSINIVTKKVQEVEPVGAQIRTFQGLPKEMKNDTVSVSAGTPLISGDKTQALIVFTTYDQTQPPSDFDGSLPALSAQEFTCSFETKSCVSSHVFADVYKNFKTRLSRKNWFDEHSSLYWKFWDSEQHLLYGNLRGEGIGSAAPIYQYNTETKKLSEMKVSGSVGIDAGMDYVPDAFLSPSLTLAVVITQADQTKGTPTTISLFDTAHVEKPKKVIALPSTKKQLDTQGGFFPAVAWTFDEQNLILETSQDIYLLNLESEKMDLLYTDTTQGLGGLYLDFNSVAVSPSGQFITFVDYDKNPSGEGNIALLKAIRIADGKIIELLRGNDFYLYQGR